MVHSFHSVLGLCCNPRQLQDRLTLNRLALPATGSGLLESKMFRKLLLTLPLLVVPGLASAENMGPAGDRVTREVEAMQRDGRWERAIAEGRANKQAFEALRQAQARVSQPAIRYTASDVANRRDRN